jgi:hypothetical protein
MMAKRASGVCHASFILEKHQMDQSNDRDPGDRIGDNKAVPQSAAGRIMLFQHGAVHMVCDHRRLPGKLFPDKRFVSCRCFDLLKPIIGEFMTRDANIPAGRLRDVTYLSVNKVAQNDGTTDINCISWMLRPFDFEIESNLRRFQELRLCMAAFRCAQHRKRANRTKRLSTKTIFRAAQFSWLRAADVHAAFSFSRPISFKELGNSRP